MNISLKRDTKSYPSIKLPLEVDGHGYVLDGIPIEEEEIVERVLADPSTSLATLRLAQQFRHVASRSIKSFFGCIVGGGIFGYLIFLALRGDLWLWVISFVFMGFVAGIVMWTVIRADANMLLRLLVDSYNLDRGYNSMPADEDNNDETGGF